MGDNDERGCGDRATGDIDGRGAAAYILAEGRDRDGAGVGRNGVGAGVRLRFPGRQFNQGQQRRIGSLGAKHKDIRQVGIARVGDVAVERIHAAHGDGIGRAVLHHGNTGRAEQRTLGGDFGRHVAAQAVVLAAGSQDVQDEAAATGRDVAVGKAEGSVDGSARGQGNGTQDRRVVGRIIVDDEDIDQRDRP